MTHIVPLNLPVYIQCLRVPVEWGRAQRPAKPVINLLSLMGVDQPTSEPDSDLLQVRPVRGSVTNYDPWEKRNDFFRLKPGDTEGLLSFLRSVGMFESATSLAAHTEFTDHTFVRAGDGLVYRVDYLSKVKATTVWALRRLLENTLKKGGEAGEYSDFQVRIVRNKGQPRVILTTTTFMEALLLTLSVDRIQGAKVRKCARPDCAVTFSSTGGHKRKYCCWYCGHIESVRKQRRMAKQKSGRLEGIGKKIKTGVKHGKKKS